MTIKRMGKRGLLHGVTLLLIFTVTSVWSAAENNMYFHGTLVVEPCVIPPGEENITLNFGTIVDKYLYLNMRTLGQPFELHLTECDLSVLSTVTVMFQGTENPVLPGLLAINGNSETVGIAIGLETASAKPLPLNSESDAYSLQEGSNVIALKAYVQGEPEALVNKSIVRGTFSAVATFRLAYE